MLPTDMKGIGDIPTDCRIASDVSQTQAKNWRELLRYKVTNHTNGKLHR